MRVRWVWVSVAVAIATGLSPTTAGASLGITDNVVTGVVTDAATGAPLSGMCAIFFSEPQGTPAYKAETDSSGRYVITVPDGTYAVQFKSCTFSHEYAVQWWDHVDDGSWTPLHVGGLKKPEVGRVDAALHHGGTITGRVTDAQTGAPLAGICVSSNAEDALSGVTDSNGDYTVRDVQGGAHALAFSSCSDATKVYADEYYSHQPAASTGNPVSVTEPNQTVVDETLLIGGGIAGHVVDAATGSPVSGVWVSAFADDTISSRRALTDADGYYEIHGLFRSARYGVFVSDPQGRYQPQWWDHKSYGNPDFVSVDFNTVTSGIDVALDSN